MIITILFVCGFKIYKEYNDPHPYQETTSTDEYAYIAGSQVVIRPFKTSENMKNKYIK